MKRIFDFTSEPETKSVSSVPVVVPTVPKTASLEAHVRLQQHQEEFLAWLDSQESNDRDQGRGYSYRKIR